MIKNKMSIKKCLTATLMAGTMVLNTFGGAGYVFADDTNVTVSINYAYDYISVPLEYSFYTTAKPTAKKIPSAEKWTYIRDDENESGFNDIYIENIKKAGYVYVSKTPNPTDLKEILAVKIGAKPKAVKVTYDASKEKDYKTSNTDYANAKSMFTAGITDDKTYFATQKYGDRYNAMPVKEGTGFSDEVEEFKETGGTLYFYDVTKPSASANASTKKLETDKTKMTEFDLSGVTRPTQVKAVKIAKRAKAPAVKIDYANHTITLKKGLEYQKIEEYGEEANQTASWDAKKAETKAAQINAVENQKYAIRTAAKKKVASAVTYLYIPESAKTEFANTSANAAIVGEYNYDSTLQITGISDKEAFQYAIVDTIPTVDNKKNGEFDYAAAADKSKCKWVNVKTKAAGGKYVANVKLANSKLKKYVMVRKAAVGSTFSSEVKIFQRPASATESWKYLEFKDYSDDTKWNNSAKLTFEYISNTSGEAVKISVSGNASTTAAKLSLGSGKTIKAKGAKSSKFVAVSASVNGNDIEIKKGSTEVGKITNISIPAGALIVTIDGQEVPYQAMADVSSISGS